MLFFLFVCRVVSWQFCMSDRQFKSLNKIIWFELVITIITINVIKYATRSHHYVHLFFLFFPEDIFQIEKSENNWRIVTHKSPSKHLRNDYDFIFLMYSDLLLNLFIYLNRFVYRYKIWTPENTFDVAFLIEEKKKQKKKLPFFLWEMNI